MEADVKADSIITARGASVKREDFDKFRNSRLNIVDYGAGEDKTPACNTAAINRAIRDAHDRGGAVVVVPKGVYRVYTVVLQSNLIFHLSEGSVLQAAEPGGDGSDRSVNYEEPEVNCFAGIQDHGHSYFANSLVYGRNLQNVMIEGSGCLRGFEERDGVFYYVLKNGDPENPENRNENGHRGKWFGNKGIALVNCERVCLSDFSVVIGGHFALIAEGVNDLTVENVLLDTSRDAFNIDCCQRVTVRNCTFNSLTDDALVLKSSFALGKIIPTEDVLIEDCTVCGYDAGSVYAKTFTREKLVAEDRCGPTGRVKLGTEGTGGYSRITVRRVKFDRSRGFALEAIDGSPLTDILFEDCEMEDISSSPIFLRAGDRCRFPVTGTHKNHAFISKEDHTRQEEKEWVLPNLPEYGSYPPVRYVPAYCKDRKVCVDGHNLFTVADSAPMEKNGCGSGFAEINRVAIRNVTIKNADPRYPILLMGLTSSKLKNITLENIDVTYRGGLAMEHAVEQRQLNTNWKYSQYRTAKQIQSLPWLVNAFFSQNEALLPRVDFDPATGTWKDDPYNVPESPRGYAEPSAWGILPAYGLYARHVEGLELKNVHFRYMVPDGRHVMVLDDVENAVLDGVAGDCMEQVEDRHVEGLELKNVHFRYMVPDGRHVMVLDDVENAVLDGVAGDCMEQVEEIALVNHRFKRPTDFENVPEEPYFATSAGAEGIPAFWKTKTVEVNAPEPGTLPDSQYPYCCTAMPENGYTYKVKTEEYPIPATVYRPFFTVNAPEPGTLPDSQYPYCCTAMPENGYTYKVKTEEYPIPATVYRPFFTVPGTIYASCGERLQVPVTYRNPLTETTAEDLGQWEHGGRLPKPFAVMCSEEKAKEAEDRIAIEATYRNPLTETTAEDLGQWEHGGRLPKPFAVMCSEEKAKEAEDRIAIEAVSLPEGGKLENGVLEVTAPEKIGEEAVVKLKLDDGILATEYEVKIIAQ